MKMADVRKTSEKELNKKIDSTREEIASLRRERFVTDEKNVNLARGLRRDLARMLTEQRERQDVSTDDEKSDKEAKDA